MKILKTVCSMILCLTLITVLSACSGGGGSDATTATSSATQGATFAFGKNALVSAKTAGKSAASTALDPTAKYASLTVKDSNGTTVLSGYKTDIYSLNGSYITATIPLPLGSYQLTEFLVLDSSNNVLYLVPTQSAAADIKALVSTVLPISFSVTKDVANTITLQVLAPPDNSTPQDYGYPSVTFSVVSYVSFMSSVQTLNSTTSNWQLIDANLTVNGVAYSHPSQTTTLRVAQTDSYALVFSKTGFETKTVTLSTADIANYKTAPLVVILTPTVYRTVSFNSNGGSAIASQSVATGGVATSPASPTYTGYTFGGWYSDSALTNSFSFSTIITSDITLYAKWTTDATITDPTTGMVLAKVAGGTYTMGDTFGDGNSDESPTHLVTLSDFYIGKYLVTQGEWQAVMGSNPSYFTACGVDCPVEQVSWNDIQTFITTLNQRSGKNYRFPTEAEWEYAARSGGKSEKYSGSSDINAVAWYSTNSSGKTHPVGQKQANGLGLYDMSGNVWEWVNDLYGAYSSTAQTNPTGPSTGSTRVFRGGSWYDNATYARTSRRFNYSPDHRALGVGFRLAAPVQ